MYYSKSASVSLGSGNSVRYISYLHHSYIVLAIFPHVPNSCRSASGSNQPEPLSIEYSTLLACETTPPRAISKPTRKKAAKGKAKEAGKNKKKEVSVPYDSPAMGTRSKTTPQKDSPASQTRSKRKLPLPDLNC